MAQAGGSREFPWDTIAEAKARAAAHPDGLVDLSMGTPVDPTPDVVQKALVDAADAPSYPTVLGPVALRQAAVDWLERRFGITGLSADQVLASIGSKELIGNLPTQLGLGPSDLVVVPEIAYPTYEVGAQYAGCRVEAARLDGEARARAPGHRLPQLTGQPARKDPRRRPPAQDDRLGAGARHAARVRRVLPGVRVGGRAVVRAAPGHQRRVARGRAGRALAVEAVEHGGLPRRVRRR